MGQYIGTVLGVTPSTTADNWAFDAATDEYGEIISLTAGGEETASAAIRSRVARSSGGGTPTAQTPARNHPHSNANLITFASTWNTQPTLATTQDLAILVFNAHGGYIHMLMDPTARPQIVGADQISNRNEVGAGTGANMSAGVVWSEP